MNRNGRKIALGLIVIVLGAGVLLKVIPPETDIEKDHLASFQIDGSLVSNPLDLSERTPVLTPIPPFPASSNASTGPRATELVHTPGSKPAASNEPIGPIVAFGPGNSDVSEGGSGAPGTSNPVPAGNGGLPPSGDVGLSPLPPIVTGGGNDDNDGTTNGGGNSGSGGSGGGTNGGSAGGGASNPGNTGGAGAGNAASSGSADGLPNGTPPNSTAPGNSPVVPPAQTTLPFPPDNTVDRPAAGPVSGPLTPPVGPIAPSLPDSDFLPPAIDLPVLPTFPGDLGGALPPLNPAQGGNLPSWPAAPSESGRPPTPHVGQAVPEPGSTVCLMAAAFALLVSARRFSRRSARTAMRQE